MTAPSGGTSPNRRAGLTGGISPIMSPIRFSACVLFAAMAPAFVSAQEPAKQPPAATKQEPAKTTPAKTSTWDVVKVGEDIKVMESTETAATKKKIDAEFDAAIKKYNDAKKAAEDGGKTFDGKMPTKQSVTVLAASLKSKDDANKEMAKLVAEAKKAKDAKEGAKKGEEKPVEASGKKGDGDKKK
jgi:hypothetical protein